MDLEPEYVANKEVIIMAHNSWISQGMWDSSVRSFFCGVVTDIGKTFWGTPGVIFCWHKLNISCKEDMSFT